MTSTDPPAPGPSLCRETRTYLLGVLALFAVCVAARAVILFTGQSFLRSDEAVVGLMAKHIWVRGERPLFFYGQSYGGGHAIVAYIAAPLMTLFGSSAQILTAITATVSVINIGLVLWILHRHVGRATAIAGAAVYACSPPVVYQSFLVNGGTEATCLALCGLACHFHAAARDDRPDMPVAAAGAFCGLAYYAMDYALLYAIVISGLWLTAGGRRRWRALVAFGLGFALGAAPLLGYNVTHDFANFRRIFASDPEAPAAAALLPRMATALWRAATGDLAVFFSGNLDDYTGTAPGIGAWFHAIVAACAVPLVLFLERRAVATAWGAVRRRDLHAVRLPPALVPTVFVAAYLAMYAAAKFSGADFRTPRYFIPLCPFASIVIAQVLTRPARRRITRFAAAAVLAVLLTRGAAVSMAFGLRPCHQEHLVETCGREIEKVAEWLREKKIRTVFAPYEIGWRLMFATDEKVVASAAPFDDWSRYPAFDADVMTRIVAGEPCAWVVRQDFAFITLAMGPNRVDPDGTIEFDRIRFPPDVLRGRIHPVGNEFVIIAPVTRDDLPLLWPAAAGRLTPRLAQHGERPH